jgi:hypothetical protein
VRGRSFAAAGGAAVLGGLALREPDLVRAGALLIVLPAASALIVRPSRYRLAARRRLDPPRVAVGEAATVTVRIGSAARLRAGVLAAGDVVPDPLRVPGAGPRSVLAGTGPGGHQELSYQIRP